MAIFFHLFVTGYEERALRRRFGDAYLEYRRGFRAGSRACRGDEVANQGLRRTAIIYPRHRCAIKKPSIAPFLTQLIVSCRQDQESIKERLVTVNKTQAASLSSTLIASAPWARWQPPRIFPHNHGHMLNRRRRGTPRRPVDTLRRHQDPGIPIRL